MQSNEPFTNQESAFANDNHDKEQIQKTLWQEKEVIELPPCKFNELDDVCDYTHNTCNSNHEVNGADHDAADKLAFCAENKLCTDATNCLRTKKETPLENGAVNTNVDCPENKLNKEQFSVQNSFTKQEEGKSIQCEHQEKLYESIERQQEELTEGQIYANKDAGSVHNQKYSYNQESQEEPTDEESEEEIVEFHYHNWFVSYLKRLKGAGEPGPPWISWSKDAIPSFIFSTLTLLILAVIYVFGLDKYNLGLSSFLPSFGASCTLVMYLSTTPGAQPRALISTHVLGAFLGISFSHITKSLPTPLNQQLASAFGVSLLTSWMMLTGTLQPSASATTCLAAFHLYGVMHDQGFMFMITPALIGPVIVVFMGWLLNNLVPWRRPYPV